MSRTRTDGLKKAPSTGSVRPLNADQSRWRAICYTCGHKDDGDTRGEATELHVQHQEADHAEED